MEKISATLTIPGIKFALKNWIWKR